MSKYLVVMCCLSIVVLGCNSDQSESNSAEVAADGMYDLYIGTYTEKEGHVDGKGDGVYHALYNASVLSVEMNDTIKGLINPSYVHVDNSGSNVYVVNEISPDDAEFGSVWHYVRGATGELKFVSTISAIGYSTCHLTTDANDNLLLASNYMGGVMTSIGLLENGKMNPKGRPFLFQGKSVTSRQEASHPHSTIFSVNNKFAYVADLGTDKIMIFSVDSQNRAINPTTSKFIKVGEGSGPRHMEFNASGDRLYVFHELSNEVETFKADSSTGDLYRFSKTSSLPDGFIGDSYGADIHMHPSGKYLYASNRGHNSIATFTIEADGEAKFRSTTPCGGDFPRNFAITPDGKSLLVANQNTDNVVTFAIDSKGDLAKKSEISVKTPVCLKLKKRKA